MRISTPMIPRRTPYSPMSPISPVPVPYPPPRIPFIVGPAPTMTFVADVGSANFINNVLKLMGGTGLNTSATGNTVTFNMNVPVAVAYGGTGLTSTPIDGQLLIGNGFGYSLTTLTAGSGISIANGSGTISIASLGYVPWSRISANQTLLVNNGYICGSGGSLTLLLPPIAAVGDIIEITLNGATGFTITQSAGQSIRLGNQTTTAGIGGTLSSTAQGDSVRMVCVVANNTWNILSNMGNPTIV